MTKNIKRKLGRKIVKRRLFKPWKAEWGGPGEHRKLPEDYFVKITPEPDLVEAGKVVRIQFHEYAGVTELQVHYKPVIIEFGKLKNLFIIHHIYC